MSATTRRSTTGVSTVVGLSISYDREALLARGLGIEHLRDMLKRLGRPILRASASLAYGGHWAESEDNFTFDLLDLVSAEQADNIGFGPDSSLMIGRLYNHAPWPNYLAITPRIEARWIDACRIVRVTQAMAGIAAADRVPDIVPDGDTAAERASLNKAIVLSAMRRLQMTTLSIIAPGAPSEICPPIAARIMLAGKSVGYAGFMPGLFEEALVTLQQQRPLYILGGFGGACQLLADAILGEGDLPEALTLAGQLRLTPALQHLVECAGIYVLPSSLPSVTDAYAALDQLVRHVRSDPATHLNTGLPADETRELMTTRDVSTVVRLVRKGLKARLQLSL